MNPSYVCYIFAYSLDILKAVLNYIGRSMINLNEILKKVFLQCFCYRRTQKQTYAAHVHETKNKSVGACLRVDPCN